MIKVGLSTRNRYVISEMGTVAMVPVAMPVRRQFESDANLPCGDRSGPDDRGSRCLHCGAAIGGREAVGPVVIPSETGDQTQLAA